MERSWTISQMNCITEFRWRFASLLTRTLFNQKTFFLLSSCISGFNWVWRSQRNSLSSFWFVRFFTVQAKLIWIFLLRARGPNERISEFISTPTCCSSDARIRGLWRDFPHAQVECLHQSRGWDSVGMEFSWTCSCGLRWNSQIGLNWKGSTSSYTEDNIGGPSLNPLTIVGSSRACHSPLIWMWRWQTAHSTSSSFESLEVNRNLQAVSQN